jgi:hypothetical protein
VHIDLHRRDSAFTSFPDSVSAQQMLTEDLLQLALAKAQGEETPQAHSVSCNIFGAIAPFLDEKLIMRTFLHKAMALCQVGAKPPPQKPSISCCCILF